jgi:hypothetical protein
VVNPGLKLEGFHTKTEGNGTEGVTINTKTLKLESTEYSTASGLAEVSFGADDGSVTVTSGLLGVGVLPNGTNGNAYILELTIPTSPGNAIGTTIFYNPQYNIDGLKEFGTSFLNALANPKFVPVPLPVPAPVPIY